MATTHSQQIVSKLWSYCNLLRDDGLSYGDYVEQLTYLLFLKMAHERTQRPWSERSFIPAGLDWPSLTRRDGPDLEAHYRHVLESLATEPGMLGTIFQKSQNRIADPAKLARLVKNLIDRETWLTLDTDTKGDAYEGLLERNAQDTKGGAGQYFTPRALIDAIVDCVLPRPGETVHDPAAGTAGFLLSAHRAIGRHHRLDRDQQRHLRLEALSGTELVAGVARLAAMNLLLHGVGPLKADEGDSPIAQGDSLLSRGSTRYDVVLANPPFGKKSSVLVVTDGGEQERETTSIVRDDFIATTSNKQLNFLQHIKSILTVHGRAAVVLPDNVLFEGGAGETIRRDLLKTCDVHTLLRLPTGIFYAQGVKANVLFLEARPADARPQTERLWIYDLRTNRHFTLKTRPLQRADLDEFVACYRPDDREHREATWSDHTPEGRWRAYGYEELVARDKANLDIFWLRDASLDDAASLEDPDVIAADIIEDLQTALDEISAIYADLAPQPDPNPRSDPNPRPV